MVKSIFDSVVRCLLVKRPRVSLECSCLFEVASLLSGDGVLITRVAWSEKPLDLMLKLKLIA